MEQGMYTCTLGTPSVGELKKLFTLGSCYYDCPQEVASNGGMHLIVVSDGSLLDKCRWRQLVGMAAVVLALISFCALRNFFKGFPKALISKLSNSDTDRDYEEGQLPGEGEVHLEAGVLP